MPTTKRRASEAETACWTDLEQLGRLLAADAAKRNGNACRQAIIDIRNTLRVAAEAGMEDESFEGAQLLGLRGDAFGRCWI